MSVGPAATSRAGVPVAGRLGDVPRRAQADARAPSPRPTHTGGSGSAKRQPISHSGGSGAVAGSWHAVEAYYLRLMNCTRTGGWVTSGGACSSPGGRNVRPLVLSDNDLGAASRGRTRSASRPTTSATTSSAGRRATACGAPATAATAGARTSAAGRATRTAPSSARTCSSRARGRTTAATTAT